MHQGMVEEMMGGSMESCPLSSPLALGFSDPDNTACRC